MSFANIWLLVGAAAVSLFGDTSDALRASEPSSVTKNRPSADPLLDDLKSLPPPKRATEPGSELTLQQRLQQELTGGEDLGEENQMPLLRIGRRMKLAEELLAARITSTETQKLQRIIEAELRELVQQSSQRSEGGAPKRQPQEGKPSKSGDPQGEGTGEARATQPLDSTHRLDRDAGGGAAEVDPRDVMRRLWGHLPEKVREQMLNASPDRFLPQYERLIQDYYRRLAEEPALR